MIVQSQVSRGLVSHQEEESKNPTTFTVRLLSRWGPSSPEGRTLLTKRAGAKYYRKAGTLGCP